MRVNRSVVLAVVIALAAVGWVASGQFANRPATAADAPATTVQPPSSEPTRVRVMTSNAVDYTAAIRASGHTEAARTVQVRAETAGRIAEIAAAKGSVLEAGALILRVDESDRPAQLERAKARVEHRRIEYEAARQLAAKGYQAETRRAEAQAALQDAKAELARIQVDLERTRIVAPFRAVLDKRPSEIGDYVEVGDTVATLVELDPLRVVAQIPEQQAPALVEGMQATARLSTGQELPAVLTYTAAVADTATRTFRIEADVPNPDGRIGQGITAELRIPLPARRAHQVPPSAFLLDPEGRIGVKVVDDDNVARFVHIAVLGSGESGAWISGLAENARIIVVGNQLVKDGETVTPVAAGAGAPQS